MLQFNSNLWTMVAEFYGSLLALFAAFALATGFQRGSSLLLKAGLLLILLAVNVMIPKGLGWTFTVGAVVACAYANGYFLPKAMAIAVGVLGLVLIGSPVSGQSMLGAAFILCSVTTPSATPGYLTARFGRLCGRWSFPLYITHTIGVLTLGSFVYVNTAPLGAPLQLMAAFLATWAFTIIFAAPVVYWETWYLPRLNRQIRRLFAAKS